MVKLSSVKLLLLCLLLVSFLRCEARCGDVDGLYICRQLLSAPNIDGKIEAGEWAGTDEERNFTLTSSDTASPVATSFRMGYDRQQLYVAVRCDEPNMKAILAQFKNRDDPVFADDAIELAFDLEHEHTGLFKFIVNSIGTLYDSKHGAQVWNGNVRLAASQGDGFWAFELAVPLSELGRATPRSGEVWGMNVFRERYASGKPELINWANAFGIFTFPQHMAHMVFADKSATADYAALIHPDEDLSLTPELARHPNFEGKPWSRMDIEYAREQSVQSKIVTPHVDMAGPFKEGPVRALAFLRLPGYEANWVNPGTMVRDFVELSQRFDVQFDLVYVTERGLWGGKSGERRLRALLQDKHDVYVFADCSPKDVPAETGTEIEGRITDGAGTLIVGSGCDWLADKPEASDAAAEVAGQLPIRSLTHYSKLIDSGLSGVTEGSYPAVRFREVGKGRGAALLPRGDIHALTPALEFSEANLVDYDYWLGLAGFAICRLAGRQSEVKIELLEMAEVEQSSLPMTFLVKLTSSAKLNPVLEVTLRDSSGSRSIVLRKRIPLEAGKNAGIDVMLPRLAQGDYDIEVRAISGKSVLGYSATRLTVKGKGLVETLQVDEDTVERGGTITGRFETSPPQNTDAWARAELVTSDGRILARKDCPLGSSTVAFSVGDDTTPDMQFRVSVMDKEGVLQTESKPFAVPNRQRDSFNWIMWDAPTTPVGLYALESMGREGFNVYLEHKYHAAGTQAGWSAVPYTTRLTAARDANGIMSPGCWSDEKYVSEYVSKTAAKQEDVRKHGVFVYSLGDENDTAGCCLHPACLIAYRKHLQKQYGSIEALNESWGESYKSFDDVQLLEGDDFFTTSKAFQSGNYPRWFDRQVFAKQSYANVCAEFAKGFRRLDPKAITGFEGAGRFGEDPDMILDSVGIWNTYADTLDDVLRTIVPQGTIRGNWMGYTKDAGRLASVAWRAVCSGANTFWWWRWEGVGKWRGFLRPTFDPWPASHEFAQDLKVTRDGLGKLLMDAKPEYDGVAIFYSVESALAQQIPAEAAFGNAENSHAGLTHALKELGIQFKYVTPRRVAKDVLSDTRVLFLPRATAVDAETTKLIRAFVEKGGTVIADIRPGIMNGHLKTMANGSLDDLFGVKRSGPGRAITPTSHAEMTLDSKRFSISTALGISDAHCAAAGAIAGATIDGTPLFLVNKFGKGRAILLNFNLGCYIVSRDDPSSVELRRLILACCQLGGAKPAITLKSANRKQDTMTEMTTWKVGGGHILALRRDTYGFDVFAPAGDSAKVKSRVEVRLPSPKVVYDLRNGKCLGRVSKFNADLRTGYANFYGVFDQEIPTPVLSLKSRPNQGGTYLGAVASIQGLKTAVKFSLVDPSGGRPIWGTRVVSTNGNIATASWQLPVNQPGKWTVEAKELFTGRVSRESSESRVSRD